jgi:hypothetical protein
VGTRLEMLEACARCVGAHAMLLLSGNPAILGLSPGRPVILRPHLSMSLPFSVRFDLSHRFSPLSSGKAEWTVGQFAFSIKAGIMTRSNQANLLRTMNKSELEVAFPRILQAIVLQWSEPDLDAYFWGLATDVRGDRKGFPPAVLAEIVLLRELHSLLHPKASPPYTTYPWDDLLTPE